MNSFGSIVGPTVTSVERVEMLNITVQPVLGKFPSILLQSQVGKYPEPKPIGVWHAARC
jgi:hypothetical protein